MRVLVTNDDGVESPGLAALTTALRDEHEVFVVAPDRDMSGSSASIARFGGVRDIVFNPGEIPGLHGVPVHTIAAGPGLDERDVGGLRSASLARCGPIRIAIDGGEPIERAARDRSLSNGSPVQLELRDGAVDPEPGSDAALLAAGFATYTGLITVGEAEVGADPPTVGATGTVERHVVAAAEPVGGGEAGA